MVTHDEQVARHASRIIRLFDGRIVEDTRIAAPRRDMADMVDLRQIELSQPVLADVVN